MVKKSIQDGYECLHVICLHKSQATFAGSPSTASPSVQHGMDYYYSLDYLSTGSLAQVGSAAEARMEADRAARLHSACQGWGWRR